MSKGLIYFIAVIASGTVLTSGIIGVVYLTKESSNDEVDHTSTPNDMLARLQDLENTTSAPSVDQNTTLSCPNTEWSGDQVCDDLTNTLECDFDGGDCCLDSIDDSQCNECICYNDGTRHPSINNVLRKFFFI